MNWNLESNEYFLGKKRLMVLFIFGRVMGGGGSCWCVRKKKRVDFVMNL